MITCDIRLPVPISIPLVAQTTFVLSGSARAIFLRFSLTVIEGTTTMTSSASDRDSSSDADTLICSGNLTPGTDRSFTRASVSSVARVFVRDHKTVLWPVRARSMPRVVAHDPVPTMPMCVTRAVYGVLWALRGVGVFSNLEIESRFWNFNNVHLYIRYEMF